ncbi:MAG: sugar phosphate isomerase/epimerase [Patescibacteria group bacterium]|nr:sugar phosphate isomerase/epimerase [Patescibacteria group bacterium]
MIIGISTSANNGKYNQKRVLDFAQRGFRHLEFNNKNTRLRASDIKFCRDLKKKYGLSYSLHSLTQDLFCTDQLLAKAELEFLIGEIRMASLIGCQHLIFHIVKKAALTATEKKRLQTLIKIAKKNKVKLCLENNCSRGVFASDYLSQFFAEIKGLSFCLDIGHLNRSLYYGLIANLPAFLKANGQKIVQIHVHYNNGLHDQHNALNKKGEIYLKDILKQLKTKNLLLVIENKKISPALQTRKILKKIIKNYE